MAVFGNLSPLGGCGMNNRFNLALNKFDNFHGQKNARWVRDQPLHYFSPARRSYLISLLSPPLFYSPETYLHSLKTILVDDTIFVEAWRTFVKELHDEWKDLIIIVGSLPYPAGV